MTRADVVVIGGGVAGLSAAVRLASVGRRVVLLEQAPRLGGRTTSFVDRESGERVDNGQHVLFGCYRDTYDLLRLIGADDLAPLQPSLDLTMADSRGRTSTLRCPPIPPPWHLIAAVVRWNALPWRARASARFLLSTLVQARRDGAEAVSARVAPGLTVTQWLAENGQTTEICRWLWRPLTLAALNQSPEIASARPFVRVLAELFGPRREDSAVGLPRVPLDELFGLPAQRFIESHGGEVVTKTAGRITTRDGRVVGVTAAGREIETTVVVGAVAWHAFEQLWAAEPPPAVHSIRLNAAGIQPSPIVSVNLWLDRPVMPATFVGLVDGAMHWIFDKSQIHGDRATHVSLVASGANDLAGRSNDELTQVAVENLQAAIPAARAADVLRSVVVREHRATFSLAPGSPARPAARTLLPGFFLAGDWTDTGLPATIEGAAKSGRLAAEAALTQLGGES